MPRTPTKAVIATEERRLLERQRVFRFAADRVTAALARCGDVEAIALIGSVARPLRREVPRFAPYKQLRLAIAKRDCLAVGCGQHQFLKQHDEFSFWPQATAEGVAVRLYDRISGGIIAQAVDLPLTILDADP
jgi:hypothetical protein